MSLALIGYTGFVGSTLDLAMRPSHRFRSTNIEEMKGKHYDHIVCAGVQAMKWWANQNPDKDLNGIERLLNVLDTVTAERFTLISTIDVYPSPRDVSEDTLIDKSSHHPYGLHRLIVEEWVRKHFDKHCILRLPGLFGPGLKKNVIYDLIHDNNLENIHENGIFQYYDTRLLADDIHKSIKYNISLLNVSSEPIATSEIRDVFFPGKKLRAAGASPAGYDMKSNYASIWNGENGYLYSKKVVLQQLGNFLEKSDYSI